MLKPVLLLLLLFAEQSLSAQQTGKSFSLHQLLQQAEENYPSLKAKKLSIETAKSNVEISMRSSLPGLDASYQLNYATHNNISGMAASPYFVPISGPVAASNNFSPVFGTVTGLLFNWQPISFGQRQSQIAFSQAGVKLAAADAANEILEHKIKLANIYLDAITIFSLYKLYEENIRRTETNLAIAKTLVITGIKPGADTALFAAELSRSKIDLINNQKNYEQALISLKELAAETGPIVVNDSSYFTKTPLNTSVADSLKHPLQNLYLSSVEVEKAKKITLEKSTSPVLAVWGTGYARGSGIQYDGSIKSTDGLGLQRLNYGIGVQLSMPLLQAAKIKPQLKQQNFLIREEEEKLNTINSQLSGRLKTAESTFRYALDIMQENSRLVNTADFAYNAILSRYTAGLANYADLIQAQYNLVKAATDQKTAYMAAWKALLYKAAVTGDLNLFLNQVN